MKYKIQNVDRFPSILDDEVVYISEEFEMAALNCACGCGHRVNLLLGDGHTVKNIDGLADIYPSVGVWDASCKSHFFIRCGDVIWAESWSQDRIDVAMQFQSQRHDEAVSVPWYKKWWHAIRNIFRK